MQSWAGWLDGLCLEVNVIPFERRSR